MLHNHISYARQHHRNRAKRWYKTTNHMKCPSQKPACEIILFYLTAMASWQHLSLQDSLHWFVLMLSPSQLEWHKKYKNRPSPSDTTNMITMTSKMTDYSTDNHTNQTTCNCLNYWHLNTASAKMKHKIHDWNSSNEYNILICTGNTWVHFHYTYIFQAAIYHNFRKCHSIQMANPMLWKWAPCLH